MRTIKVTNCTNDCPFYTDDADEQCAASEESSAWFKNEGIPPSCALRKEAIIVELDE